MQNKDDQTRCCLAYGCPYEERQCVRDAFIWCQHRAEIQEGYGTERAELTCRPEIMAGKVA